MSTDDAVSALARATSFNEHLDNTLTQTGIVSQKLFLDFKSVENDPNASSVGWLESKLRVLSQRIDSGASLSLHEPERGGPVTISTRPELEEWARRHFPVVHWQG